MQDLGNTLPLLDQWYKFMIRAGEWIIFELIKPDPAKASRPFQSYPAGFIVTAKNFHDNFKMGIGMLNLR